MTRPDRRLKGPPDYDRAAVWRRMLDYFLKVEKLDPHAWGVQNRMAERLDLGQSTIQSWFSGRSHPDIMIFRFARVYPHVNLRWLAYGEEPMELVAHSHKVGEREAGAAEAWAQADIQLRRIEELVREIRQQIPGAKPVIPTAPAPSAELEKAIAMHRALLAKMEASLPKGPGRHQNGS